MANKTKSTFFSSYKKMSGYLPDYTKRSYIGTYNPSTYKGNYKAATYKPSYEAQEYTDTYNPEAYQSKYTGQIEQGVNNLANWTYNPLKDASYQAMAKLYTTQGNLAAKNSLADAAALNGGMGTSAAVTAAQQSRNQYNQQLAAMIPQLEQTAYERAATGTDALMALDNALYGRFSDDQARQLQAKQFGLDVFNANEAGRQFAANLGFDYDQLNEQGKQFAANYGLNVAQFNEGNRYNAATFGLDKYLANQGERQFAYNAESGKAQNTISNAYDYLNYLKAKEAGSGGGGGGRRGSGSYGGSGNSGLDLESIYKAAQEELENDKKKKKEYKVTNNGGTKATSYGTGKGGRIVQ